ncbi:MAG: AMP-binding protein, partial [Chloroflexota bacterium]
MKGLMMDFQLTVPAMLRRAEQLFAAKEVVSRLPDRSLHRCTYADVARRAKRLALALRELGVQPGDRVATFCWNHHQHLEAYFGVPCGGAIVHTINPRLHPSDLSYIVNHADDRVILVDQTLLPLWERVAPEVGARRVIVVSEDGSAPEGMLSYERLLSEVDESAFRYPEPAEDDATAMCYTSGTTGRPKAVLYSHRSIALHSLLLGMVDAMGIRETDVVCPVVPMFHVSAWGIPYACVLIGAKQVFPGPYLDPLSLLDLFVRERVTFTAGVPTIWLGILQVLDQNPGTYDLSSIRLMGVGGSAAPESMIRGYQERHGLQVLHAWGMTETTPLGTVANLTSDLANLSDDERYAHRARQGTPMPFVEIRARGEAGLLPWDGATMGELEVRGPWIAGAYYESPGSEDRFTEDGWFKTGDIVTIDRRGSVKIQDRAKDLIKSGGEWISSVELENALMGHPA